VTPDCVRDKRTTKYVTYESYHELAYLHPNHFTPNPDVLEHLNVEPGEPYFILRLVALKAYHDIGQAGLRMKAKHTLIDLLSKRGKVFITVEGYLPDQFKPYQLQIAPHLVHDAMSYATMLISDSQTMTAEAAVLGTPAIRCNTFVGRISYLEELEHRYGLTYGFLPDQEDKMIAKIETLLASPNLKAEWQSRRTKMLQEKIDTAQWITNFVEKYPASFREYQKLRPS
jgi:predicted glycosyltransferase